MKKLTIAALALLLAAACQKSDRDRVDGSLQNNQFFKALGAVPNQQGDYVTGGSGLDGDTSLPISAARTIHDPTVSYEITANRPNAGVDFTLTWPCTLMLVYTDLPGGTIRDTVYKPAPKINGAMHWDFTFQGDSWTLTNLTPCLAKFDSALNHIKIDSLQVEVHRAGQTVPYPTLDSGQQRLAVADYPYSFHAGDSVTLHLWETDDRQFVWAFLHAPYGTFDAGFRYDSTSHAFYGTWVVGQPGNDWVWFEAVDLHDAILDKAAPDRAIFWGLPYKVQ